MENEKMLTAQNVAKRFGKKQVLENVNLTLEPHRIYGLIGRNGAGKTTLLGLLSGQNPVSDGEVLLDGKKVWENEEVLSQICFSREISQMTMFGKNTLKAKDYLKMASLFYPKWDKTYADALVKLFGLDTKKRLDRMSKGMLSMLTIIVALASKADFTFLDEPVAGLDVAAREHFYNLLNEEFIDTNRTFVISTHIIEEAANLLNEIIIVNHQTVSMQIDTEVLLAQSLVLTGRTDRIDAVLAAVDDRCTVLSRETIGAMDAVYITCDGVDVAEKLLYNLPDGVEYAPIPLQKLFIGLTK